MAREIAVERTRNDEVSESKIMMNGGSKDDNNRNLVRLNRYTAEDTPVRRKIKTSSSIFQDKVIRSRGSGNGGPSGYLPAEIMQNAANFVVTPSKIVMGRLCEGCRYKIVATVKNTGSDTSRFRLTRRNQKNRGGKFDGGEDSAIHQLRVIYRAGPLAAGMHARLELEIKAKGVGIVEDHFEIVTEHQILKIPVTCEIVTALAHDPRHVNDGVKLVGYIDK